jgi:hypothetical protein
MDAEKVMSQPDSSHEAGSNPCVRQRHSRNTLYHEIEEIRRVCDELRLQVHLGGVEARDLWAELEERFDAAEARLERNVLNKCAKLGGRVYELAGEPAVPDGMPTHLLDQVLDDDEVKRLVAEIESLDDALRSIRDELSERELHNRAPQEGPQ